MKNKLIAVVAVVALAVPGISMAQTVSVSAGVSLASLQAEITALLAQVQTLEAQIAASSAASVTATTPTTSKNNVTGTLSSAGAWCYNFNANLSAGMSGAAVTALQNALNNNGESISVTGTFDAQTEAAVKNFQEKYQNSILGPYALTAGTGFVGATTRKELNSLFRCDSVIPEPVMPPVTIPGPTSSSAPSQTNVAPMIPASTSTATSSASCITLGCNAVEPQPVITRPSIPSSTSTQ